MSLAGGDGGALVAAARLDGVDGGVPVPVLVDTATVLTTFGSPGTEAHIGGFTMFGVPDGTLVPRFTITNVPLFETPLASVGVDTNVVAIGGVIGGDMLSRFVVGLDYRAPAPSVTLFDDLRPCRCELSTQCQSVVTFTLAGGQDTQLQGQTYVAIGNNLYTYPPSRVLIDACLEPLPDPLSSKDAAYARCAGVDATFCPGAPYRPTGADVKLVVATGFPGIGLSATAYDRLRGAGAAAKLLAGPTVQLHIGDLADDGSDRGGVRAALTTLGRPAMPETTKGASALAIVGSEGYFGPCAELARSRRLRRRNATGGSEAACLVDVGRFCSIDGGPATEDAGARACFDNTHDANCSDNGTNDGNGAPAAAVLELTTPLPVYVLPDVTPLFVSLNADVRPSQPSIDGVIGTAGLSRLVTTIDYPQKRLVASCASAADCLAYVELTASGNCDFCMGALTPLAAPFAATCPPAPPR